MIYLACFLAGMLAGVVMISRDVYRVLNDLSHDLEEEKNRLSKEEVKK